MTASPEDRVVAPLRAMRLNLQDGLRQVHVAAASVETAEMRVALAAIDAALEWLRGTLLPYSQAEQYTLFPAVDGVLGATGTCQPLIAQHAAIGAMVGDLGKVAEAARSANDLDAYRRFLLPLLHGIYALARAHLESEDDAYLGLLDAHLSESQVGVIVDNIRRIVEARGAPSS